MILRRLHPGDASSVLAIEEAGIVAPWSAAQIESEFQFPTSLGFAAEIEEQLVAFALFRTCAPECELLRLVVHPHKRRQKIASSLLGFACRHCAELGFQVCFLEVRASNIAALRLYTSLDFHQDGRRKRYYTNPEEDALLLHRDLHQNKGEAYEKSA